MSLGNFGGSSAPLPFVSGGGGVASGEGMGDFATILFPHAPVEIGTLTGDLGPAGSAARAAGTAYQNTSNRKRRLYIRLDGGVAGTLASTFYADQSTNPPTTIRSKTSIQANALAGQSHQLTLVFEVSDGWYYQVDVSGTTIGTWNELDE